MTDCIETTLYRDKGGYGRKMHKGRCYLHHRYVYEQAYGPIPKGMLVRHKCDNRACINIEHLELGTHVDNMQDAILRGRVAQGEIHGMTKFSVEDAKFIRNSKVPRKELAKRYNVHINTIDNIRQKHTWKHMEEDNANTSI